MGNIADPEGGQAAANAAPATVRRHVYVALEPSARSKPGLSLINKLLTILILAAALSAILETEPLVSAGREQVFRASELSFGILFLIEYAARLWTAVENPRFAGRSFPRLRYALTVPALIDLIATLPALFAFSGGGTLVLRFFRILRMVRLAKLGRTSRAWQHMSEAIYSRRYELGLTFGILVVSLLMAGSLLYWAEADVQPDKFGSIPRALWWGVITLTTVGYGDTFPITPFGKFLAGAFAITGVALIALPTGIFAASFSDALQRDREKSQEDDAPPP